ncbi:hypothetical protein [Streptomyces mirabilis]|uniref:hypothetical protein n=1 Tax=Streptomyces mirabilis TaxID=68239 RepID=UPI00332E416D
MDVAELGADSVAGLAGAAFGDADQNRAGRRSSTESALGFQERLAADRDLLSGQVRVGAGR